jgi:hypothetical protein
MSQSLPPQRLAKQSKIIFLKKAAPAYIYILIGNAGKWTVVSGQWEVDSRPRAVNIFRNQDLLRKKPDPSRMQSEGKIPRGTLAPHREKLEQENRVFTERKTPRRPPRPKTPGKSRENDYGCFGKTQKHRKNEHSSLRRPAACSNNRGMLSAGSVAMPPEASTKPLGRSPTDLKIGATPEEFRDALGSAIQ